MGGLSIWHWLILLAIVVVVFGTKKLKNIGGDVAGAVRGFKEGMKEGETPAVDPAKAVADKGTIDVEAREKSRV